MLPSCLVSHFAVLPVAAPLHVFSAVMVPLVVLMVTVAPAKFGQLVASGFSARCAAHAVTAFLASERQAFFAAVTRYLLNCGIAMAASMAMMATTTRSSIRVKPLLVLMDLAVAV